MKLLSAFLGRVRGEELVRVIALVVSVSLSGFMPVPVMRNALLCFFHGDNTPRSFLTADRLVKTYILKIYGKR